MSQNRYSLSQINAMTQPEFTKNFGGLFEHSPWVAEETYLQCPFSHIETLHKSLCQTMQQAGLEKQLALIRAHPDLVGRAAREGTLTQESTTEQASAGLNHLTAEEIKQFDDYNRRYREKFGFPFIICARLNKKDAILKGFELRLNHSRKEEIQTALKEIEKIAELRLRDLIKVE